MNERQIEMARRLAAPFDPREIKYKPQSVKGNRALALAFVDVRAIMDRLDEVVGPENWQDDYELLPDMSVICRLRIRLGKSWVVKTDVGSPSEQPDGGDRVKAAFSDALKRTAVKFGIGRYLYRLPARWLDYDPVRKQFAKVPPLPEQDIARPAPPPNPPTELPPRPSVNGDRQPGMPADGDELFRRLRDADAKLAAEGRCAVGALLEYVLKAETAAGFGGDPSQWTRPAIELAVKETNAFKKRLETPSHPQAV